MQHQEHNIDIQLRRSSSVSTGKCHNISNKGHRAHNFSCSQPSELQNPALVRGGSSSIRKIPCSCSCSYGEMMDLVVDDKTARGELVRGSQLEENSPTTQDQQQQQQQQHRLGISGGLSQMYQPKVFADIIGHDMIIKALANATQMKRISTMYLFHGPGGTGKTSVAKIFSMALNCESTLYSKPCWVCVGCYRSLYTAELCSGKRNSGFDKIRTLLQSTSFRDTISGYKVFIIDECHSLSADSWVELQDIDEKGKETMVFIMITEDAAVVPRAISSRCQKFNFQKLKDSDITQKLAKIVTKEGIEIKNDALTLIARKADGNLREAENLLDQLALLRQRITASMVQQILGLVPHDKLTQLLEAALTGNSIEAVRRTRELIACGIEPKIVVSQLATLVTETLAGNFSSSVQDHAQIRSKHLKKLCNTLRTLVETEKQLSMTSHDHTTWVTAALLQIASDDKPNGTILLESTSSEDTNSATANRLESTSVNRTPHSNYDHADGNQLQEHPLASLTLEQQSTHAVDLLHTKIKQINMEEVWCRILERIDNNDLGEFLRHQSKLISLTLSRANAIVHLVIMNSVAPDMSEELISNALKDALGCPTTVNISHEPLQHEVVARNMVTDEGTQVLPSSHTLQNNAPVLSISKTSRRRSMDRKTLILKRSASQSSNPMPSSKFAPTRKQNNVQMLVSRDDHTQSGEIDHMVHSRRIQPFPDPFTHSHTGNNFMGSDDHNGRDQIHETTGTTRGMETKHTFLSITSIPYADAIIEPYSQDLLFEEAQIDRQNKARNYFSNPRRNSNNNTYRGFYGSWSCAERFCPNETTSRKKCVTEK
ncbi:hypothetical protein J5N97_026109 [Dioscorea zingiberensis]|uniref:AAA+ ATPase domain-containing protein n=1 Tax=Dioscorea zingiberensis TaxID=325984 RepID=A0A9D5C1G7_9LILI|nr:hypothetical protein J5N97_026109 [Dioscorea zingiberensis]